MSALLYLEHLNDADLALLAAAGGFRSSDDLLAALRESPDRLDALLGEPTLHTMLFGAGEREALLRASPFLVFSVLVAQSAADLARAQYVEEWVGPGRRVPMFEVSGLRGFLDDPVRRLFLAELLASYTRVASGSIWVQTSRGWRRRRFSELDPLRLVEMAEMAPDAEKPALYRRLGDLALFLTGVFPDYAGTRLLPGHRRQRLQRIMRASDGDAPDAESTPASVPGDLGLLERLGRRSYWLAWKATGAGGFGVARVLGEVAAGFGTARRSLNFLTDRYLFRLREEWFAMGEG
jgi:hypothetical protein